MSHHDEDDAVDWPKILMGLAIMGLALYAISKLQKNPEQPALPETPPGAQPALPPGLSEEVGDSVVAGDAVTVASRLILSDLPDGNYPEHMAFVVLAAVVGSKTVLAAPAEGVVTGERLGFILPFQVPRSAIVAKTGKTSPNLPVPVPPAVPGGNAPQPTPGGEPVMLGNPIALQKGRRYRARLDLSSMENMMASPSMISAQFASLGFTGVTVWQGTSGLPSDWPTSTRSGDTSRAWFVEGTWSNDDGTAERPSQVTMVWGT